MAETYLVPSVIILIANLLSGELGSNRWENVTMSFGLLSLFSVVLLFILPFLPNFIFIEATLQKGIDHYLLQVMWFCGVAWLSRDYERIFKPLFNNFFK